jgi:hypothetical protein
LIAAVIIGSSLAGVQISIKSRTVVGGNCDSVTLADATVALAVKIAPSAKPADFISFPLILLLIDNDSIQPIASICEPALAGIEIAVIVSIGI